MQNYKSQKHVLDLDLWTMFYSATGGNLTDTYGYNFIKIRRL